MKKVLLLSAANYFVLSSLLFSQSKTVFHYPLNIGDMWEYWEGPNFFIYEQRKVIGDTILPNEKHYKTIEIKGNLQSRFLKFQRIEEQNVFEYAPRFVPPDTVAHEEILICKLEVGEGDTWPYQEDGYQGFLADSGFYYVSQIDRMSFGNREWTKMAVDSYTLPDMGLWFHEDIILLDSLGLYQDAFEGGYYQLRGAIINGRQFGIITSIELHHEIDNTLPESISLIAAYPNPVLSIANFTFHLERPAQLHITIFDVLGRQIYEFPMKNFEMGVNTLQWNGVDQRTNMFVASGIYFFIITDSFNNRTARKFTVLK
jgi:hypothetical protein